ncbi:cochaperonin GroES [uncultured Thiomicrorhabdus sp.]
MNIKPLQDRVVVRRVEEKRDGERNSSAWFGSEKENTGEVVAVGPGKASDSGTIIAMTVKVGDKVMFVDNAAITETKDENGESVMIMREDFIVAIVE